MSTALNAGAARTPSTAFVSAVETTTNTGYVDLPTVGPAVTVTTGSSAIIFVRSVTNQNTAGGTSMASYAISVSTVVAASDTWCLSYAHGGTTTGGIRASSANLHTGLTPGSNTFTMKYRVTSGTGTYDDRRIMVIPL